MNDAQRLSVAGSDRERALLRAGAEEEPTAESVHAAARVLGIVPRAALLAYAIVAAVKGVKWSSVIVYVLAPAAAVGAIATAGYLVAASAAKQGGGDVAVVHAAAAPRAEVASVSVPAPPPVPVVEPAVPVAKAVARHTTRADRVAPVRGEVAPGLQQQVDLLDRARALASSGDPSAALRSIDDFDRRFARGPLAEEAALVRIEATAARGDRSRAVALAQRFLVEHPRSVHAATVRALVDDAAN